MKHIRWAAGLSLMLVLGGGRVGAQLMEAWHTDQGGVTALDSQGNLYVAYRLPANPGCPNSGDGAVTKYDSEGNVLWTASFRPHGQVTPPGSHYPGVPLNPWTRVIPTAMTIDAAGNAYFTGTFEDAPYAWGGSYFNGEWCGNNTKGHFVAKVSAAGDVLWVDGIVAYASSFFTPYSWPPPAMTPDNTIAGMWLPLEVKLGPDGSVFVSGQRWYGEYDVEWLNDQAVFMGANYYVPYVARYSPSGEREWLRTPSDLWTPDASWSWWNSWNSATRYSLAVPDYDGSVRLVFWRYDEGGGRVVTTKFDSGGGEQWTTTDATPPLDLAWCSGDAVADSQGNVLLVADPGSGSSDQWERVPSVRKYLPDGSVAWTQTVGIPGTWAGIVAIAMDGEDNAFVAVDNYRNEGNVYWSKHSSVHKIAPNGSILWETECPGPLETEPDDVVVDDEGNPYLVARIWHQDPLTFEWSTTGGVYKFSGSDGSFRWVAENIQEAGRRPGWWWPYGTLLTGPGGSLYAATAMQPGNSFSQVGKYIPNTQPDGPPVQAAPGVTLTFYKVTSPGVTTATTSTTGPEPPAGFRLGNPATYCDIETEALFTGQIQIAVSYAGISYRNVKALNLFHYENGAWVNVTTGVDTVNQVIRGTVASLSPFIVAEPKTIDIKPGVYPNTINLGSNGTVPVAILGYDGFDAATVDPLTVTLASAPVRLKGKGTPMFSMEDVNADGRLDMVVHVSTEALTLTATDTEALLSGMTLAGQSFSGADTIRVVP